MVNIIIQFPDKNIIDQYHLMIVIWWLIEYCVSSRLEMRVLLLHKRQECLLSDKRDRLLLINLFPLLPSPNFYSSQLSSLSYEVYSWKLHILGSLAGWLVVGFGKGVEMVSNQIMGREGGQNISSPLPPSSGTASLAVAASLHRQSTYWAPPLSWF